jgi:DNA-binding SARP family transcriptional activator
MMQALNTLRLGIDMGDVDMLTKASLELSGCGDAELVSIARSATLLFLSSDSGTLGSLSNALIETARINRERGHRRHEGISLINLAFTDQARGDHGAAAGAASRALSLLAATGDATDVAAARVGLAKARAHQGAWAEALSHLQAVLGENEHWVEPEAIAEAVELLVMYGDPASAQRITERRLGAKSPSDVHPYWALTSARLELALGRPDRASELIAAAAPTVFCVAYEAAVRSLDLQIRASRMPADATLAEDLAKGLRLSQLQEAWFWWKHVRFTQVLVSSAEDLSGYFATLEQPDAAYLSIQAELVVRRLGELDQNGFKLVFGEALRRPERWRLPLRRLLTATGTRTAEVKRAVEILEEIGQPGDVALLRSIGKKKSLHMNDAGRGLMHRLAPRVYVEDLGRVSLRIGETLLIGTEIRRKVLSLLCFLLTRPQLTATREQVLEALWPEMDPEGAANSLNQSAYFLRRIFEPGCDDDSSAGYLRSRSDLIWLDNELVGSRSNDCLDLLSRIRRGPSPELIVELANSYTGRFAVDFLYDDWASSYRDTLHAGFLDRIERAIITDTNIGAFDRALTVAQLALQADPEAEQIELCLLRLYRRSGANAAAAEQYSHYAGLMRDQLGIEPPPLESI